jgi:hypothetical protein
MTYGQQPDPNTPPPYGAPLQGTGSPSPGYSGQPQAGQPQYGQPGYGQQPGQYGYAGTQWSGPVARPGSVTAGCVLAIIGGIVAILLGGLFLVVSGLDGVEEAFADAGLARSWFTTLGGIVLVVGALVLTFAIIALRGKWWAAIALAVMGGIYIVLAIWSMIQGQGGVLVGVIWIALSVGMLMSTRSRAWFQAQR